MQVNAFNYVHQDVCKVEAHLSYVGVETETYFKGKCILMSNIQHE